MCYTFKKAHGVKRGESLAIKNKLFYNYLMSNSLHGFEYGILPAGKPRPEIIQESVTEDEVRFFEH